MNILNGIKYKIHNYNIKTYLDSLSEDDVKAAIDNKIYHLDSIQNYNMQIHLTLHTPDDC